MNKKAEKKEKKPTLTQRVDAMDSRLDKIFEVLLKKDEPEEPKEKEPDRDAEGNIIKYFKFVSPNTELLQMTSKRGHRKPTDQYGGYVLEPPELCSFGRDTDGPPGFFKTPDEDQALRLREVLAELTAKKLPHVFTEVTDDPAFADF